MTHDLVVREEMQLTPKEVVDIATAQAKILMDIVEKTSCYQEIAGKKYLQVEAWETIGAFNRTHAETKTMDPILKDGEIVGYEARVQLWKDGVVVGGAIMPCYFTDYCCKGKEGEAKHKASMSAAQTFATSKAYRMNYSYIAILAGYQSLPAEEITEEMRSEGKNQHWCETHQTNFFKTAKMKSYAHPIKDENGADTGEWCYEKKAAKPPEEKVERAKNGNGIDWGRVNRLSAKMGIRSVVEMNKTLKVDKPNDWKGTEEEALDKLFEYAQLNGYQGGHWRELE